MGHVESDTIEHNDNALLSGLSLLLATPSGEVTLYTHLIAIRLNEVM